MVFAPHGVKGHGRKQADHQHDAEREIASCDNCGGEVAPIAAPIILPEASSIARV